MKQSRDIKNQNPKVYGYGSLEHLLADPERFGDDPAHPLTHWVVMKDAEDDVRFVPCTEEYFHSHRNERRNELRRKDLESRCMIPSEKFGLVKCRADCTACQKKRDGHPVSMDYIRENYDFEFSDNSYEDEREKGQEQEQKDFLWHLVSDLDSSDQQILKLFSEGKTDGAIAEVVKKSRSMVQERRVKLVQLLKEKVKKYDE